MDKKITKILFALSIDEDVINAQSLNAREMALRLDPERFSSHFFVWRRKDSRFVNCASVTATKIPSRAGTVTIASQLIWGDYDIIFYPPLTNVMHWYRALRVLGRQKHIIKTIEESAQQIQAMALKVRSNYLETLRQADACFAISSYIADSMRTEFALEMPVVPIGVDTNFFKLHDRSTHQFPLQIVCVASLQPRKQIHLLLDLAKCISPNQAQFHIVGDVIGSRDYYESLLKQKHEHKLDHVFFHSGVNQAGVRDWLFRADIFVLPSRLEGTPKVLMEAAATGLPCIVFSDYHTPSVLDNVTGFQVPTFNVMLESLYLLIDNHELRLEMGESAVKHIKQYDWNVIAKQWEQVFMDMMNAHS